MRKQDLMRQQLRARVGEFAAGVPERELPRELPKEEILGIIELAGAEFVPRGHRFFQALNRQGLQPATAAAPHGIRQDLFGIIDILALDPQRGVVGVQSTGQDFAGHMRKLTEERPQECLDWLSTPGTALELWAWRKVKAQRGGKQLIWQPRVQILTRADFQPQPQELTH